MNKTFTIVTFYWLDSDRSDGWEPLDDKDSIPSLVFSNGILIKEEKEFITISSSITSHEKISSLRVPKVSIVGKVNKVKKVVNFTYKSR